MAKSTAKSAEAPIAAPAEVLAPRIFQMGEKKYSPRVAHNEAAWEKVQGVLIKGKGKATHAQLAEVLKVHFSKVEEDHINFISYMTRRGSLVEVPAK